MTDTTETVVETTAHDANASPEVVQQTGSEAESSTAVTDTDDRQPRRGVGARIDELTRNWREAERREAALLELLRQREQQTPAAPKQPEPEQALKTLADFEYDDAKYQRYLFDQAEKRAEAVAERKLKEVQERESRERRNASFVTRANEFAKTVEDYEEVVRNPRLHITPEMADVIKESDDGPALAYHLGKNPDVADKIAQLPPIVAARELGKIEARLAYEREKAKEAKSTVSKAPAPPPKVEGADPGRINVRPDDPESDKAMSHEEWVRARNKQIAKRG